MNYYDRNTDTLHHYWEKNIHPSTANSNVNISQEIDFFAYQ
jgi:hypothetical protein